MIILLVISTIVFMEYLGHSPTSLSFALKGKRFSIPFYSFLQMRTKFYVNDLQYSHSIRDKVV